MAADTHNTSQAKMEKDEEDTVVIREGKAEMRFHSLNEVFYNPVQEFNRDLSVAVLTLFSELTRERKTRAETSEAGSADVGERKDAQEESERPDLHDRPTTEVAGIKVLEGLSASGLRSVRYALEVPGIEKIVANDISDSAFKLISENIKHNGLEALVIPSREDASMLMYKHRHPLSSRFDAIDLDPYGSASTFLDGAVQAIADSGVLMVTCTDMGVLCGNHSEACYGKYGGMSLKAKFCHEMALRLLLSCIESHANRYKRYIVPLLSISVDFYVRVFVRVCTSASEVKRSASKMALVYHCFGCGSFHFQPMGRAIEKGNSKKYPPACGPPIGRTCDQCNQRFHLGGPIWTPPIHDTEFVNKLLVKVKTSGDSFKTSKRMEGLLTVISEELQDCPLYYTSDRLSSVIHCQGIGLVQLRSAIISLGYRVSSSHASPQAIKTDAPHNVLWDIMRCWEKLNPAKRRHDTDPGTIILNKEPEIQVSFETAPGANPDSRKKKLLRFQVNPTANWGPKARAKRKQEEETQEEKRRRLQGKRQATQSDKDLKLFACRQFIAGNCEYGEECRYSHVLDTNEMKTECMDILDNDKSMEQGD